VIFLEMERLTDFRAGVRWTPVIGCRKSLSQCDIRLDPLLTLAAEPVKRK